MDGQRVLVRKVHYKTSLVLATSQLVIGMATLGLYVAIVVLYFNGSNDVYTTWHFGGIFCTLCIFATGTIGVFSANNLEDAALSLGYVIFCVLSMIAALAQVVLFITRVSMWLSMHQYYICMSLLILLFMALEFFVSVLAGVYCCTNAGFCNAKSGNEIVTVEEDVLESVRSGSVIKGKDVVVSNDMTVGSYKQQQDPNHQSIQSLSLNYTSPTPAPTPTYTKTTPMLELQSIPTIEVKPSSPSPRFEVKPTTVSDVGYQPHNSSDFYQSNVPPAASPSDPLPPAISTSENLRNYDSVHTKDYIPIPPKEDSLRMRKKLSALASSFQDDEREQEKSDSQNGSSTSNSSSFDDDEDDDEEDDDEEESDTNEDDDDE